jgi:hypothetical protein
MNSKYGKGDIWQLASTVQKPFVVIPTNLVIIKRQGRLEVVMGAGLAKQASDKYPNLKHELALRYQKEDYLGDWMWSRLVHLFPEYGIIAFPTKKHWQERSKLDLIDAGLAELRLEMQNNSILKDSTILVPQIGSGLGGLDWSKEVRPRVINSLVTGMDSCLVKTIALIE